MAGAVAFIRYAKNVFAQVEITARVGSGGRRIVKVVSVVGVNCVARQAGRQPGRHVASLANSLSTRLQAKRVSQPINVFTSLPSPLACRLCVHNLSLPLARPAIEVARRAHTCVASSSFCASSRCCCCCCRRLLQLLLSHEHVATLRIRNVARAAEQSS